MDHHDITAARVRYEIRFQSLFNSGRGLSFPCDAHGRVQIEELSERARHSYQHAQLLVGREYATPAVQLAELH